MPTSEREYRGLLFIGDPHLASRVPGFRKDDYPRVILAKLAWCLDYAAREELLPVILGDLFHHPRDNANWLLGEVLALLDRQEVLGIYGNHDCREDSLGDDDSLSVVFKSRKLRLIDTGVPWSGRINGRAVIVGGTPWGQRLPRTYEHLDPRQGKPLIFWIAHHDVKVPGYEEQGRFQPFEIPGIEAVINGHIHRRLEDAQAGGTTWITPGNIARISRSDATRRHVPAVLRVHVSNEGWTREMVPVPHAPFDQVFHDEVIAPEAEMRQSSFVKGLAELQARRTEGGAGLIEFLRQNTADLEKCISDEVMVLAQEVIEHGSST